MKLSKSGKIALAIAAGTVIGTAVGVAFLRKKKNKFVKKKLSAKLKSFTEKGMDALNMLRETLDKLDEIAMNIKEQNAEQDDNKKV